jgi:hypothetical protein
MNSKGKSTKKIDTKVLLSTSLLYRLKTPPTEHEKKRSLQELLRF